MTAATARPRPPRAAAGERRTGAREPATTLPVARVLVECRWPTWTGRTTTWSPSRTAPPRSRGPGCGCGSPAGWSAGTCSRGSPSPTTRAAGLPGAGGVGRAGADAGGRRAGQGGRRPVRGLDRPTCCGSPCRRGTPGPRRSAGADGRRGAAVGSPRRRPAPPTDAPAHDGRDPRREQPPAGWAAATRPGPAFLGAIAARASGARGVAGAAGRGLAGPLAERPRRRRMPGAGRLLIVPDARDLARLDAALGRRAGDRAARHAVRRSRPGRAVPAVPGGQPGRR